MDKKEIEERADRFISREGDFKIIFSNQKLDKKIIKKHKQK